MSRANEITFSREQEEVLYGTLLGDASMNNPNTGKRRHAVLQIEHSTKQIAYCQWKAEMLGMSYYTRDRYDVRTDKTYHSIVAYSQASPTYNTIYEKVYGTGGFKGLSREILDGIGPLGLAVWYMDDGCTIYNGRICKLHTEKYTLAEQQIIQQWFIEKWNLHPTIQEKPSNGHMKYILVFTVTDSYTLMNIIRPFVVTPDLQYKVTTKPYTPSRIPQWHPDSQVSNSGVSDDEVI